MYSARLRLIAVTLLPLALTACGATSGDGNAMSLDDELASGADADPLLAAAVSDPIMSDPRLSSRSNADAIRPPSEPYAAPVPVAVAFPSQEAEDGTLTKVPDAVAPCRQCAAARDAITLAALAARLGDAQMRACAPSIRYSAVWASRLPADLPLHRRAQVTEAAGADSPTCHVRAVTFTVQRPIAHMLDWYFTQATRGGYSGTHQSDGAQHILSGSRARGGSYVAILREADGGGSEIDLVVNTDR